ncbi:MAG: hypothetical protein A2551_04215 [Elusimicrobia bacterium RIFOXYD2_FULL_34_30]|nr:MAG: hypothetical protein A2551_04215 [Elusimicrobia bacterium RIFOXYD2_FULL_34_30]
MWYIYLDESGDLGFDFVNKKPSKYFTITVLTLKTIENNKKLSNAVEITLRRKFKNNPNAELKGSACPINIKKYFYEKTKNIEFNIYSITLNKKRVYEKLAKNKNRVYNWISRKVLDEIPIEQAKTRIELIIDKSKDRPEIIEFNDYIRRQLEGKIDPKVPIDIYHYKSCGCLCLQVVDMFCWGIFRKYERKDLEWYNVFKKKVQFDEQYL